MRCALACRTGLVISFITDLARNNKLQDILFLGTNDHGTASVTLVTFARRRAFIPVRSVHPSSVRRTRRRISCLPEGKPDL